MEGWIKLHRAFINWEWFDNSNMVKLFIYLILKANHKEHSHQGTIIKRGQIKTGLDTLSSTLNIPKQQLRTCLSKLEKTGEINTQATNKYRIITVCKYDSYQYDQQATNTQHNKQLTSKQQTTNKQLTANKNDKKLKNDNNEKKKEYIDSDFLDIWNKWLDYKKELKNCYKTDAGEKTAYNKLIKLANNNKAKAKLIINQSIEKEWKGLFDIKGEFSETILEINIDNYLIPHNDHFGYSIEQLIERIKQGKYSLK